MRWELREFDPPCVVDIKEWTLKDGTENIAFLYIYGLDKGVRVQWCLNNRERKIMHVSVNIREARLAIMRRLVLSCLKHIG